MSSTVLSAIRRAAGRLPGSASSMVMRPVSGSHVLRIQGYKQIEQRIPRNASICSSKFNVGGHDWQIQCFPHGLTRGNDGSMSLYLQHASQAKTGDAAALFELSILDQAWKPSISKKQEPEHDFSRRSGLDSGWHDFMKTEDLDEEKHLHDGCLKLRCDLTVLEFPTEDEVQGGEDLEIVVGGETFTGNWEKLALVSPVFKAELAEAISTVLHIHDMDADVFKAMLHFVDNDTLPEMSEQEEAALAERLIVAADRYKIGSLKMPCEVRLLNHIGTTSVVATLAMAEQRQCGLLKDACMRFLSAPGNLKAAMATGGFDELLKTGSMPVALMELIVNNMP